MARHLAAYFAAPAPEARSCAKILWSVAEDEWRTRSPASATPLATANGTSRAGSRAVLEIRTFRGPGSPSPHPSGASMLSVSRYCSGAPPPVRWQGRPACADPPSPELYAARAGCRPASKKTCPIARESPRGRAQETVQGQLCRGPSPAMTRSGHRAETASG